MRYIAGNLFLVFISALVFFSGIDFVTAGAMVVEIEGLPDGYSLRYGAYEPILKALPDLRPRVYRRLRFPGKDDELAFALKTGNAPDIMSLNWLDYRRLAEAGQILDLSDNLLREADIAVSQVSEAGWTPLRRAGDPLLRQMLVDGRIYGFPARKEIHGLIVRRDLLKAGDPVDRMTAPAAVRLAGLISQRMNSGAQGRGIAIPLDTERFLYWSIADYGVSISDRENNDSEKRGEALAALQGVYGAFRSVLHESVMYCPGCNAVSFVDTERVAAGVECQTCLTQHSKGVQVFPPVGLAVGSVAEGLELFRRGKVASVVCTRSSMVDLVESGMTPGEIRFIPLAGTGSIPDVQILALYRGVPERENGADRKRLLIDYLKLYSSQFLIGSDSPLYLWYERNLVSLMVKEGYRALYSDAEIKACEDISEACGSGLSEAVNDSMIQYRAIIPAEQFADAAGIDIWRDLEPIVQAISSKSIGETGFAGALLKVRSLRLSQPAALSILVLLLAGILASGAALFLYKPGKPGFRACLRRPPRIQVLFVVLILLIIIFKAALPVILTSLSVASVIVDGERAGIFAYYLLAHAGRTTLDVLISIVIGCSLALLIARLVSGLRHWSAFAGLVVAIPLAMAGFWGYLLVDAVVQWFCEMPGRESFCFDPVASSAIRAVPAAWALLPVFVSGYVCRLRRIDPLLYDVCGMDGGTAGDGFFVVTLPALEPVLKLHALVLACIAILSTAPSLAGSNDSGAGGHLLRSVIFDSDPVSSLTLSGLVLAAVLTMVWLGHRWMRMIKVMPVYRKSNL